jgi:diamine N-acetyltransferase
MPRSRLAELASAGREEFSIVPVRPGRKPASHFAGIPRLQACKIEEPWITEPLLATHGPHIDRTHMNISLREVSPENLQEVLAITLAPEQEPFVGTVAEALEEAAETPEGNPWYRVVYDAEHVVGFVMLSWNVTPDPPAIIGPWYVWKLIVDRQLQGRGYGRAIIQRVADIVRAEGAQQLLTSFAAGPGGPEPFYARVGFVPTGAFNEDGETVVSLRL